MPSVMTLMKTINLHQSYIFVGIIIALLLNSCGADPLTVEDSPDRNKTAVAYTYSWGNSNTYVSIYYNRDKKETDVLKLKGVVPIAFEWVNDKELNVYLPNKSLITYVNKSFNDVKLNLIEEKK